MPEPIPIYMTTCLCGQTLPPDAPDASHDCPLVPGWRALREMAREESPRRRPGPPQRVRLLPFDYRPGSWDFRGDDSPSYYGMEIEISDGGSTVPRTLACEGVGSLGLLKADGSVEGFELVTQPMTYAWAMEHFPWDVLPQLAAAGGRIVSRTNGLHVHTSRAGFSGGAHQYSWLKFLYRNRPSISALARRVPNEYCEWLTYARRGQMSHLKRRKIQERLDGRPLTVAQRGRLAREWDRLGSCDPAEAGRYQAVNLQNADTFEVRVFASTLRPRRAQAALGLVAGSVEYTRQLTVREVCRGGWEWDSFGRWLREQGGTYQPLLEEIDERIGRVPA